MPAQASQGHFEEFYRQENLLGEGACAKVYKCVHKETGKEYAVKVVDRTGPVPNDISDRDHEAIVMSEIGNHPHVVQMIEYFSTADKLYIVLELMHGGTLFDRIVQLRHYSEQNAAVVVRNLLSALQHIHSKGIIHRDLKPENLVLRYSETNVPDNASHLTDVCLADFGIAGYVPSTTCCGSDSYMAPEVARKLTRAFSTEEYDTKCDIWSLGVITYVLLCGRKPFSGSTHKKLRERILAGQWSFPDEIGRRLTPDAKDFVSKCLRVEPEQRPSAEELLTHAWVTEEQPDIHREDILQSLRDFNARQRAPIALDTARFMQQLRGVRLNSDPPFIQYLRHPDKLSTVVYHQSQTHADEEHAVDFGKALNLYQPDFRLQDCCTCPSQMVCRHIQNVHEYLFIGCPEEGFSPLFDKLRMVKDEAEADLKVRPSDAAATERLQRAIRAMQAAYAFSKTLSKVPTADLKPNLIISPSEYAARRIQMWWRRIRLQIHVDSLAVALDGGR